MLYSFGANLKITSFYINININNIIIYNKIEDNTKLISNIIDGNKNKEIFEYSEENYDDEVAKNCKINTWRKYYFKFLEQKIDEPKNFEKTI